MILSGLNWFIWKHNLQTSFRDWDGLGFINTVVIKPDNKRIMKDGSMELLKLLDPPYLRPCILLLRSEYEKKTKIKEIKNISHPLKTLWISFILSLDRKVYKWIFPVYSVGRLTRKHRSLTLWVSDLYLASNHRHQNHLHRRSVCIKQICWVQKWFQEVGIPCSSSQPAPFSLF